MHTCMLSPHGLIGHKKKKRTKPDPEHNWISTTTSAHQKLSKQMYLSSFPGLRNKASSFKHIEIKQPPQLLLIRAPKYFRILSVDFMKRKGIETHSLLYLGRTFHIFYSPQEYI